MKELVEHIATVLVDKPEYVNVTQIKGKRITVLELRVAKEDLGKVIGASGHTARAVRTILNAIAKKNGTKVVLEIIE